MSFKASLIASALMITMAGSVYADSKSVKANAKETWNDTKRGTKNAVNDVKDSTCEMMNGKMECAAKKAGHKIEKGAGKVEDAVE